MLISDDVAPPPPPRNLAVLSGLSRHPYPPEISSRQSAVNFVTAMAVVKHYMGVEWVEKHTSPFSNRPGFFRLNITDGSEELAAIGGQKIVDLGELLLNLQHIEGFDSCIRRLRDGDLEPTLAELSLAGMIFINDWPFRFVEPTGLKRSDYDYEIALQDVWVVCADATCKIESTSFTENTILNALRKARGQLPEDQPGIVLIKFPPDWLKIPEHVDKLLAPTKEFFSSSSRVVSVAFYTMPLEFGGTYMSQGHQFMEVCNALNKFDVRRDWRLFNRWRPPKGAANGLPPKWLRLINFPHGFN
jgi:hypothetical protein